MAAALLLVTAQSSASAVLHPEITPGSSDIHLAQSSSVAAETVTKVLQDKFPNYTDPGYAECVLQNATESETQRIEDAGARDNFRAADATVLEIIKRESVQNCILQAGLPRIPF
jgi:hypothetical protein